MTGIKSMQEKRPINLNFFTIQFPITAIVSLLHRLSGILIALFIPGLLWLLQSSLDSRQQWDSLAVFFENPWLKVLVGFVFLGLIYHWVSGIRHLLMDMDLGDTKAGGRKGACYVLFGTFILSVVWFWYIK